MVHSELSPSAAALEEVRRLAGSSAAIQSVTRLEGGQHAATWRVDTASHELTVVVRQFPAGDSAGAREQRVLHALDGLGGLAPMLLGSDLDGRWSESPTLLISWLDGQADITPTDPEKWAAQLGRALATVHAVASDRLAALPSVFDLSGGSQRALAGPLATRIQAGWRQITASVEVLTHYDYWSGNVVWRGGKLTGIVDWSGGPAVHAGSTWAGAVLISFCSSMSASPTCSWRRRKPLLLVLARGGSGRRGGQRGAGHMPEVQAARLAAPLVLPRLRSSVGDDEFAGLSRSLVEGP